MVHSVGAKNSLLKILSPFHSIGFPGEIAVKPDSVYGVEMLYNVSMVLGLSSEQGWKKRLMSPLSA